MRNVLDRIDSDIMRHYQEVILLAALLNQHRIEQKICEEILVPPEQFPHLAAAAFKEVLGSNFQLCCGDLINISRHFGSKPGVAADLLRFRTTKDTVPVKTWITAHSWLCLPQFDVWIDVIPPGSDFQWLSPVRYSPGKSRPAYEEGVLPKINNPRINDVMDMVRLLRRLQKEKGPYC